MGKGRNDSAMAEVNASALQRKANRSVGHAEEGSAPMSNEINCLLLGKSQEDTSGERRLEASGVFAASATIILLGRGHFSLSAASRL